MSESPVLRCDTITDRCATRASKRNTQIAGAEELRPPAAPKPPVIAGALISAKELSFLEFLADAECLAYCRFLFGGTATSAGTVISEFKKAVGYHYFGLHRSKQTPPGGELTQPGRGKLTATDTATRKTLKAYARRAYRGDPDKRGVQFWERVAWLLWNA